MGGELISTEELAQILDEPDLRIFDCTTRLDYQPPETDVPYIAVPGLDTFVAAHIRRADFLDLQGEFSDQDTGLRFMMAGTTELEDAFRRHGVANDSRVVLYNLGSPTWATRFWWMLKSLGFDRAFVLDGGFEKWSAEGRPIERGPSKGYPPGNFTATPQPGFFVDKHAVLAAQEDPRVVVVNALGPQFHKGLEPSRYGRPGRIPGSVNVPAGDLYDPKTKTFVSPADAEPRFAAQGVTREKQVIAYCGGGISATIDLLLLRRLGYENLLLYDASMGEWAKDSALPIETG
jgi:thiosulfate/3-mercaptopyruvate sulfurtransferase